MAYPIVRRGSVILVRYPFTDLSGAKVRPAVILTPDKFLPRIDDVLCLFISSSMPVEMVTRRLPVPVRGRQDGDERGMLIYGYKFRPVLR